MSRIGRLEMERLNLGSQVTLAINISVRSRSEEPIRDGDTKDAKNHHIFVEIKMVYSIDAMV